MSTFGPIWVERYYDSIPSEVPLVFTIPTGAVIAPGVKSYFWDLKRADDLKPVVHAKSLYKDAFSCRVAALADRVLYSPAMNLSYNLGNDVFAMNVKPGRTFVVKCNLGRSPTAAVDVNYGANGLIAEFMVITDRQGSQARYRRCYSDVAKANVEFMSDGTVRFTGVVSRSQTTWGRFLGGKLIEWCSSHGILAHFKRGSGGRPEWRVDKPRVQPELLEFLLNELEALPLPMTGAANWTSIQFEGAVSSEPVDARSAFMFNEDSIPHLRKPGGIGMNLQHYWLNVARSRAFVDACENMPALSDNSISNLQEILEFLLSVLRREAPKIPRSLGDVWLAYRYQYSTTKMDIQEAVAWVKRYCDLQSMFVTGIAHGEYTFDYNNINVTCRCAVEVAPSPKHWFSDFGALWRDLSALGLAPDLYYLWDSTPFSFIVDWFLPVGTTLEAIDASMLYTAQNYKFGRIVYSLSYIRDDCNPPVRCYSRWVEDSTPVISPLYWWENRGSASKRQVVYRLLDSASLIVGG